MLEQLGRTALITGTTPSITGITHLIIGKIVQITGKIILTIGTATESSETTAATQQAMPFLNLMVEQIYMI